jgi:hypothetical protein
VVLVVGGGVAHDDARLLAHLFVTDGLADDGVVRVPGGAKPMALILL